MELDLQTRNFGSWGILFGTHLSYVQQHVLSCECHPQNWINKYGKGFETRYNIKLADPFNLRSNSARPPTGMCTPVKHPAKSRPATASRDTAVRSRPQSGRSRPLTTESRPRTTQSRPQTARATPYPSGYNNAETLLRQYQGRKDSLLTLKVLWSMDAKVDGVLVWTGVGGSLYA